MEHLEGEYKDTPSLPVRGAWIEIIRLKFVYKYQNVAPRKGSVD